MKEHAQVMRPVAASPTILNVLSPAGRAKVLAKVKAADPAPPCLSRGSAGPACDKMATDGAMKWKRTSSTTTE